MNKFNQKTLDEITDKVFKFGRIIIIKSKKYKPSCVRVNKTRKGEETP